MNPSKPGQDADANNSTAADKRRRSRRDVSPDAASRLERKRLSDRRSQRAMREKTKQRIAELESALQALLATNVNRELKEKIAENQALKEEVARLRARLERIGRLCFADSEGGAPNDSERCGEPYADDKSPKDKGDSQLGTEFPIGNKRRKISQSQNTAVMPCPQNTSPSANSSTHSPEELEETNKADAGTFEENQFLMTNDFDTLTGHHDSCIAFGNDAFWSPIHSGSTFDTFAPTTSEPYPIGQLYDHGHIEEIATSASNSTEIMSFSNGRDSIDFADLSAAHDFTSETPHSTSTSGVVGQNHTAVQPANGRAAIHLSPRHGSIWGVGTKTPSGKYHPAYQFEDLVQNALEKYKDVPKERLDSMLPVVPCMAPYFSTTGCKSSLSKGLFEQIRQGPWMDPSTFLGAYWSIHSLLRYYLRPISEEIPYIPSYMLPLSIPVNRNLTWCDFLPWPHIREELQAHKPIDGVGLSELEGYIGMNSTICWPYTLKEAISFAPPPDIVFGPTGPYSISECNGCGCSAPQLTDRFKLHLTRLQHWRLKPGQPHILKKHPEFNSVVL